ncbi:hypothetical protein HB777_07050 [Mesorhizobium loti]|nr:hypothetical protein HB777_07050 [Mesorhizobium loti]
MTLEEFIGQQNGTTFWKEFTFTQLKLRVAGGEAELADNVVWFGDVAIIIQMKERVAETEDPEAERRWFNNKVMKTAIKQIKDSMRFLDERGSIPVSNIRNQSFELRKANLREVKKVVIYKSGRALPAESRGVQYKESQSVGFIHIFDQDNYDRALNILIAPEEIRRYLDYRQASLLKLAGHKIRVTEDDIIAAYTLAQLVPTPTSHTALTRLMDDIDSYNLSSILGNLADHIEVDDRINEYAKIMVEFARVPRAAWKAAKERLDRCLVASRTGQFLQPYRFYYEGTDTSFVFSALHPDIPAGNADREKRGGYLQFLTTAGKYLSQAKTGVGVQVSYLDGDVMIDWCLVDEPWNRDPIMEKVTADEIFRPVREQQVDGFFFGS